MFLASLTLWIGHIIRGSSLIGTHLASLKRGGALAPKTVPYCKRTPNYCLHVLCQRRVYSETPTLIGTKSNAWLEEVVVVSRRRRRNTWVGNLILRLTLARTCLYSQEIIKGSNLESSWVHLDVSYRVGVGILKMRCLIGLGSVH